MMNAAMTTAAATRITTTRLINDLSAIWDGSLGACFVIGAGENNPGASLRRRNPRGGSNCKAAVRPPC
jgi:hypothetical protein